MTSPTAIDDERGIAWWLAELAPPHDLWLSALALHGNGTREVLWSRTDELDAFAPALAAHHGDLWLGCCTRAANLGGKRGGRVDCVTMPGVWLDVDIAGPGHQQERLPADLDAALELVGRFPLEPTWLVHSGGGLQAWWLFPEHMGPDDDPQAFLAAWGHTWAVHARAQGVYLDNVFDLARIMRVPGSQNHKLATPRPVRVIGGTGARWQPSDLEEHFAELPPATVTPLRAAPWTGPERPGDAYNAQRTGSDVLADAGWQRTRADRNGDEHWKYPGASGDQSATVYGDDGHTTIWSETAAQQLGVAVRRPYDPFGLYAALRHGGDHRAASDALAAEGFGTKRPAQVLTPADLVGEQTAQAAPTSTEWPEALPLRSERPSLPPWPVDVLPRWAAEHCMEVAHRIQVPVDLCAQIALGCLTTLAMGHISIAVNGSHTEPACLFLATAMPPGAGKTPADKAIAGPLRRLEVDLIARTEKANAMARARHAKAKADYEKAQTGFAARSIDENELAAAWVEVQDAPEPLDPRLLADDATPEALTAILGATGGRIAVVSAEAGLLDQAAGMYTGMNRKTNLDCYLKGWGAEPLRVDRKGSPPLHVPHALVTVAICVQPAALEGLARNRELSGRGFTQRFMLAVPADLRGRRVYDDDPAPIGTAEDWERHLGDFAYRMAPLEATVAFGPDTRRAWSTWRNLLEARIARDGDLRADVDLSEWVSKLSASVARLAGILHVAHGHPVDAPVSPETLAAAIQVGDYWTAHALAVAGQAAEDEAVEDAEAILRWARRRGTAEATMKQINNGLSYLWSKRKAAHGGRPSDYSRAAVELLVEHGLARSSRTVQPAGGGTPSEMVDFRPSVVAVVERSSRAVFGPDLAPDLPEGRSSRSSRPHTHFSREEEEQSVCVATRDDRDDRSLEPLAASVDDDLF